MWAAQVRRNSSNFMNVVHRNERGALCDTCFRREGIVFASYKIREIGLLFQGRTLLIQVL